MSFWRNTQWLLAWTMVTAAAGTAQGAAPQARAGVVIERCRTIADRAARLGYERAAAELDRTAQTASPPGGWRLVRTLNPRGGKDAVSIMRTADLLRSDADFAGLMLRCGERDLEVLVVLIQAFPPRAHPQVTVSGGATSLRLTAVVAPPGTALLLPPDAEALATGPWRELKEISLAVEDDRTVIRGVVPLDGLRAALQSLRANCPSP